MSEMQIKRLECSTCGGDLIPFGDNYRCVNCNNVYEITEKISEEETILLNMANSFRRRLNFDEALETYEQVLDKNPTLSEANRGALLCDYGIIYEKDTGSERYIPTCHRLNEKPVERCAYYQYLSNEARERATEIEALRSNILAQSKRIQTYDIFICYKQTEEGERITKEAKWAREIYEFLTYKIKDQLGFAPRVFFAERSLAGSNVNYEPHIYSALRSSKLMLVLASSIGHVNSPWVKNEWKRYAKYIAEGEEKVIRVIADDIEAYDLPKDLRKNQVIDIFSWQEHLKKAVLEIFQKAPENTQIQTIMNELERLKTRQITSASDDDLIERMAEAQILAEKRIQEEAERKRKEEEARLAEERRIAAEFEIKDGVLLKYKGNGGDVVIPNTVTSVGVGAFKDCRSLTKVLIPNSVTSIGEFTFRDCSGLSEIRIPNSVTSIGYSAFKNCSSLTSVTMGDSVTCINSFAFEGCKSLVEIVLPDSVTAIGESAFA